MNKMYLIQVCYKIQLKTFVCCFIMLQSQTSTNKDTFSGTQHLPTAAVCTVVEI